MHFGRVLRAAGLPIGPGKVLNAVNAVRAVGITNRPDFYWSLHAVFVNRRDQHELFDQAFHIFWRDPKVLERMMGLTLPDMGAEEAAAEAPEASRRVIEAMQPEPATGESEDEEEEEREPEFDAVMTASANEILKSMDFEEMSADEIARAKVAIARMRLSLAEPLTRRMKPSAPKRRVDMRATLRASLRSGGAVIPLRWRAPKTRPPPLVVLCDISGSMSRYSRMLLHFMHALTNDRDRVFSFVFGTRLTNVTRYLRHHDIDLAMDRVADVIEDWSGGTRIGECLKAFNHEWSRRVLAQGAVVMLISDGLDRDAGRGLGREIERLHKSCRRLIWLNPLLRFEGFEPKSQGIQTILPHVDEFRPVHNLESLHQLVLVLNRPAERREEGVSEWLKAV